MSAISTTPSVTLLGSPSAPRAAPGLHLSVCPRHCVTVAGLRQTVWAHIVADDPETPIDVTARVDVPDHDSVWAVGPWTFSATEAPAATGATGRALEDLRVLDGTMQLKVVPKLPEGNYTVTVTARTPSTTVQRSTTWQHVPDLCDKDRRALSTLLLREDEQRAKLSDLAGDPDLYLPDHAEEVTASDVVAAARATWPDSTANWWQGISDQRYWAPHVSTVRYLVGRLGVHRERYVANDYDCDNFTRRLMGLLQTPNLAMGTWADPWGRFPDGTRHHAQKAFLPSLASTGTREFWLIEPQTANVYPARNVVNESGLWNPDRMTV